MECFLCLLFLLLLQDGTWGGQPSQQEDSVRTPKVFKRGIGDALSRRSSVDKNFIRFGRSGDYYHDFPNKKDTFARVSRATKDNFMRFGRPDFEELFISPTATSLPSQEQKIKHFLRFGRKDNFMRFGRKENFMRFGRNFIRFGRGKDNFMRFGRGDNFMRFGKSKDNFMRFGRKDNFMRFGRNRPDVFEDDSNVELTGKVPIGKFVRFGKSPKNTDSFIRFGRNDPEEAEEQRVEDGSSDVDIADLDLEGDKPKNGPVVRIKRNASTTLWDLEDPLGDRISNDSQNVERERANLKTEKKRNINSEIFENDPVNFDSEYEPIELLNEVDLPSDARNGESSLIRFG